MLPEEALFTPIDGLQVSHSIVRETRFSFSGYLSLPLFTLKRCPVSTHTLWFVLIHYPLCRGNFSEHEIFFFCLDKLPARLSWGECGCVLPGGGPRARWVAARSGQPVVSTFLLLCFLGLELGVRASLVNAWGQLHLQSMHAKSFLLSPSCGSCIYPPFPFLLS